MAYGAWRMAYGVWRMAYGVRRMAHGHSAAQEVTCGQPAAYGISVAQAAHGV